MSESAKSEPAAAAFDRLLAIMARLRDPQNGCPWDVEQSFRTIVPHTIEEAYEVADAIERDDFASLPGELGDLMFQVVFYAQMAAESGRFSMVDVLNAINTKMIVRHPHVFGDVIIESAEAQTGAWEARKAEERAGEAAAAGRRIGALDGVVAGLPALTRAEKLQRRAARVGFDWPETPPVLEKLEEEIAELRAEMTESPNPDRVDEEIGDLLFSVVNLARHLGVDPEGSLRRAGHKFERRFRRMEEIAGQERRSEGRGAEGSGAEGSGAEGSGDSQQPLPTSLEDLEALWGRVKAEERSGGRSA
jgi:ATP diphosphatase